MSTHCCGLEAHCPAEHTPQYCKLTPTLDNEILSGYVNTSTHLVRRDKPKAWPSSIEYHRQHCNQSAMATAKATAKQRRLQACKSTAATSLRDRCNPNDSKARQAGQAGGTFMPKRTVTSCMLQVNHACRCGSAKGPAWGGTLWPTL
jgi:hypothetical protein